MRRLLALCLLALAAFAQTHVTNGPGGGSTSPGSPVNSVQFNNAGAFGGNTALTFNPTGDSFGDAALTLGPTAGSFDLQPKFAITSDGPDAGFAYAIMSSALNGTNEIDFLSNGGLFASPTPSLNGVAITSFTSVGTNSNSVKQVATEERTWVLGTPGTGGVGGRWQLDVTPPTGAAAGSNSFSQVNVSGTGFTRIGPLFQASPFDATQIEAHTDSTLTVEAFTGNQMTSHVIRAGPLQTTNDLEQWQNASNGVLAAVSSGGLFRETLHTPASSSEACTAGQFSDDASFHYVCTSSNVWKRAALSSF